MLGLLVLAVACGGGLGLFQYLYPNMIGASVASLVDGGVRESEHLGRFLLYWIPQLDRIEPDPTTGALRLSARPETGLDEAKRLFHLGQLPAAADLLKTLVGNGGGEQALFWLGVTQMRLAEAENCLAALHAHDGVHQAWCTLPLKEHHPDEQWSREAAKTFERLLDEYDPDDRLYRWLLNFSYMTVDGYPSQTPRDYLVDEEFTRFFYSDGPPAGDELAFTDRAGELGIDKFDSGRGVAVEDFDGDGRLDIVTGGSWDPTHYYRNTGVGFEDITVGSGLERANQAHMISAADYDNDGRIDLFVGSLFQPYKLLRNVDGRRFEDVTVEVGLLERAEEQHTIGWASAWGDVDNDGDLDLFYASWGVRVPLVSGFMARPRHDSRLFLQEEGRFIDRTEQYGLTTHVYDQPMIGAAFGDYDNDGFADLFLASATKRRSAVLRNEEGRSFSLTQNLGALFVGSFVDVNHDGNLELYANALLEARTSTEKSVFGMQYGDPDSGRSVVLERADSGRFEPIEGYFSDLRIASMGTSYGDLDNDGCLDFYFGTGGPEPWFTLPSLMYRGERDASGCAPRASNISNRHGFGTIQKGHGIVFFDWDDDGDQDIYSSLGGMWPVDRWPNQFFVNESSLEHSWIKIRLEGRRTNRFGIGCRIRVSGRTADGRQIMRTYHMDQKTTFGSAPLLAHIGLGQATSVASAEVYWPVSDRWESYEVELNSLNRLVEPQ